jgi:hypothetical protein
MSNVLVVDDEAAQRRIVASILKSAGHLEIGRASCRERV